MPRPPSLDPKTVDAWLSAHPGWERSGGGIAKRFAFPDFSAALAFAVRIGCFAEKRDHHPDLEIGWGRASVLWSTHDTTPPGGGTTQLDLDAAEATDQRFG